MNIFSEVKEQLTTRQVAESYGLRIRKNGVACCPFHDDRHPSMKVDKNYHCFACGVGGDVIDYTARMYGLSQYDAAKKLIEDFGLHVQTEAMSREERQRLRREKEERMRIIQIKKKFYRWCEETIELLKDALVQIEDSGQVLYGLKNERNINKAMNIAASENRYHPIREYLEQLVWDGKYRIGRLLPKYLGAEEDAYTREIMQLLMLAAIHRVYEPGCKYEIMVCLVGGQGAGKSTFFRFLAIKDEWFSDDLKRMDDDNVYRKMQGHWIIEMSEMMATVNAKSIEDIKSFISRQKETYKIPYETHPEDRPRQCVFVGTSNSMDFLPLDRTGNRRFAPILVHPDRVEKHILEDEKEARNYIIQAWAEAMELYRSGQHELKLSKDTENYLRQMQKEFMPEDAKVGIIQLWLDELSQDYVCSTMIYKEAFDHEYDTPKDWELKEINNVMNNSISGWEKISSHRFAEYGIQRGWRRIADKEEFHKLPEHAEIPFDKK